MQRPPQHFLIKTAICAAGTLALLVLVWRGFVPLEEAENFTLDWRMRQGVLAPVDPRLVLIGVDRPSYAGDFSDAEIKAAPVLDLMRGNFPWSRAVWAELITKLADAGAKAIVIDFVFASPKEGDDELKAALEKYHDRVVLGCNYTEIETDRGLAGQLAPPSTSLIEPAAGHSAVEDDRVGFVNIWSDLDEVQRHANLRLTGAQLGRLGGILPPDTTLESLDARALRKFGRPDLIPPDSDAHLFRYAAPPGYGFPAHPIGDVLAPKTWKQNYGSGEFFRGKIVLLGPTADIFQDQHKTPLRSKIKTAAGRETGSGEMLGPEIHLNIINAALHGEFLRENTLAADLATVTAAGIASMILGFGIRQPVRRLGAVVILATAYWLFAQDLYDHRSRIIPVVAPLAVLLFSSVVILAYDFLVERRDKTRVRKTLERYVSKNVVRELLDNPQTFFNSLTGVRKPVTVLFSDIRGFTTLTESADSAGLVRQLNEYFQEMVALVFAHDGSLDKFIGDAVMAVWGNIVSKSPAHEARQAVATAIAMRKSLARLNDDWKIRGMTELHIGIGLNHGDVIVGNLGSSEKMELTVIGDAVNLASRLEGLTKEYRLDLLLGENIAALVRDTYLLRLVDCVQVKGKTRPVDVFTVMGEGAGQTVSLPLWLARYEEGVRLYREREFAAAAKMFEQSLQREPGDFLSAMYLRRCKELLLDPPDESWNGVFVMTKK